MIILLNSKKIPSQKCPFWIVSSRDAFRDEVSKRAISERFSEKLPQ